MGPEGAAQEAELGPERRAAAKRRRGAGSSPMREGGESNVLINEAQYA